MFESISRGWQITKQSFAVLRADKEIILFPILSILITLGVTALALTLFLTSLFGVALVNSESVTMLFLYGSLLVYFFLLYAIGLFFEGAIVTSATIRFSGKNPTFTDGLTGPLKKLPKIVFWALINAVIALILNIIENVAKRRSNTEGAIASIGTNIFGLAWKYLTFFVIPIILFEQESTIGSIKRSKELFVKTWGENVTAQITTGGIFFFLGVLGFIPLLLAAILGNHLLITLAIILFALWISAMVVLATSVNGILIAALYQYAIKGKLPAIYSNEIQQSIKRKR